MNIGVHRGVIHGTSFLLKDEAIQCVKMSKNRDSGTRTGPRVESKKVKLLRQIQPIAEHVTPLIFRLGQVDLPTSRGFGEVRGEELQLQSREDQELVTPASYRRTPTHLQDE